MDDEPRRGRAKPQKLRVTFPDGTIYCYSSVKETFLETLRKIGASKLSKVKLEVCHLPMFTKTQYELYKDFMEPVGDGLYVNIQGNTYNRYSQLVSINNQLNLGLQIDLSSDIKGERIARGSKGMAVLEVTFPDHTVIGEESTSETFMQCIWHLGIDNVRKLNLKQGGKDLITAAKLYKGQVQIDENRWLVIPGSLKDKVKILRVIGLMLHIKMDITSFSTSESKSYKRIGSQKSHRKEVKELQKEIGGKFKKGDHVYNEIHGEGIVLDYDKSTKKYKVRFNIKYKDLPDKAQVHNIKEEYLDFMREGALPKEDKVSASIIKQPIRKNVIKSNTVRKINVGDTVYNTRYGEGQVVSLPHNSNVYEVRFPSLKGGIGNTRFINGRELQLQNRSKLSINEPTISYESVPMRTDYHTGNFRIGDKVYNKKYGEGRIKDILMDGKLYMVRFPFYHDPSGSSNHVFYMKKGALKPTSYKIEKERPHKEILPSKDEDNLDNIRRNEVKYQQVFKDGDYVSNLEYGIGIVLHFFNFSNTYDVKFTGLSVGQQIQTVKGDDLHSLRQTSNIGLTNKNESKPEPKSNIQRYGYGQRFRKGDRVYNDKFGWGIVTHYYVISKGYDVLFDEKYNGKSNRYLKEEKLKGKEEVSIVEDTSDNEKIDIPKEKEQVDPSYADVLLPDGLFKKGEKVYNDRYGEGKIISYDRNNSCYKVHFVVNYAGKPMFDKTCIIKEEDLKHID